MLTGSPAVKLAAQLVDATGVALVVASDLGLMVAPSRVSAWASASARTVPSLLRAVADKPAAGPAGRPAAGPAGRPAGGPAAGPAGRPAGGLAAGPAGGTAAGPAGGPAAELAGRPGWDRNFAPPTPPKSACRILLRRPAALLVEWPLQMPFLPLQHLQLGLPSLVC